jgi:hypothetical protein
MPALMFIKQPAAELVFDVLVNQPEVSRALSHEKYAPTRGAGLSRNLLAEGDSRFPPDSGFYLERAASIDPGPAITEGRLEQ